MKKLPENFITELIRSPAIRQTIRNKTPDINYTTIREKIKWGFGNFGRFFFGVGEEIYIRGGLAGCEGEIFRVIEGWNIQGIGPARGLYPVGGKHAPAHQNEPGPVVLRGIGFKDKDFLP